MSEHDVTLTYGRATPRTLPDVAAVDQALDELAREAEAAEWPRVVSLTRGEHVLEILVGRQDLSLLVWYVGFDEIACSRGTIEQPSDLAFDYGGHRTDAYADAAVPVETAREAVRQFVRNDTRPTAVEWQTPHYTESAAD